MKLDPQKPAENRRWLLILAVLVFAEVNSSFEVGMSPNRSTKSGRCRSANASSRSNTS